MEYTSKLKENEIRYVCELIGGKRFKKLYTSKPNNFAKIKPGSFRITHLTDIEAVELSAKYWKKPFLDKFINDQVQIWMEEIAANGQLKEDAVQNSEQALMMALPKSIFCKNLDIYFKICDKSYSDETIKFIKAGCKVYMDYENVLYSEKKNDSKRDKKVDNNWENEKKQYLQDIEKLNDELNGKTIELTKITDEFYEQESKNDSLVKEVSRYKAILDEYIPKSKESEGNGYRYMSLCEVSYNYQGRKRLNRIADIVENKILNEYNLDFPIYYKLYMKNENENVDEGNVAVWNWDVRPNIKNSSKDYIEAVRNSQFVPIEVIVLEEYQNVKDIINALVSGLNMDSPFQKQLWCCRTSGENFEGILCDDNEYEQGTNGIRKLKDIVFQLPVYEISEEDIYTMKSNRTIVRCFILGVPKGKEDVRDALEIVRVLFAKRFNWSGMKLAGFTRADYKNICQFIENLPMKNLYQELSEILNCSDEESKALVAQFVSTANKYLSCNNIETEAMRGILTAFPELMDVCKQEITAQWEFENTNKLENAKLELQSIEDLRLSKTIENNQLEQQYEDVKQKQQAVLDEIEQQRKLAVDVEISIKQRIENARKNAADFIAEMAFTTTPSVNAIVSEKNTAVYHTGESLPQDILDQNDSIDDLLEILCYELIEEGVSQGYALHLAGYMYSAYINKMPLMIAGACAKEIANAFSAALFSRTAGNIILTGDYSESALDTAVISDDPIIIINNIFNPQWNQIFFKVMMEKNKYFIAVLPYPEEIMIEPKGLLNYFTPLFTDLFVNNVPNQNYIGGKYNSKLLEPLKIERRKNNKLLKNVSLSELARNRINRVISTLHEVIDSKVSEDKELDGEMLFCVLPILILQNKTDDIEMQINRMESEGKISKKIVTAIKDYLGIADE